MTLGAVHAAGPPMLPNIPSTTLLSADISHTVHSRPRPTSMLPPGPLPRRAGAVRAHNIRRKSWTHTSNPPTLHIDIPSRQAPEPVELDVSTITTPLVHRHSDPPTATPWTDDRSGLIDLWSDANDAEGFKEAVVSAPACRPAPLRLSSAPANMATPQTLRPLRTRRERPPTLSPVCHPSTQVPAPCRFSPPPRPSSFTRLPGEASRFSTATPLSLRVTTPPVAQSALSTILSARSPLTPASAASPSPLPSPPISISSSSLTSSSQPSQPSPLSQQQQQQQQQHPSTTFDAILHHRTIRSPHGPSHLITPPTYADDRAPPVALQLRSRLDEVLRNWGEGTSPVTPAVNAPTHEGGKGAGFMAREERALSWHPGIRRRGEEVEGEGAGGC